MVTDKFNKDFSKGNKNITKVIEDIVAEYFLNEKVTEDSLRQLKIKVSSAVDEYRKKNPTQNSVRGSAKGSTTSKKEIQERNDDKKSKGQAEKVEKVAEKSYSRAPSSKSAESSSVASKSVYQVEGDDEDEWATLVKFDTELFKKEK